MADVNYEKELIKKYQRTNNVMVYKELERIYQGVITKAVLDSGLSKYLADNSTITAEALALFKKAIETYTDAKGAKPSSYITSTISFGLKNYKNREMSDVAYRSEQMNRKAGLYYEAIKELSTVKDSNSLTDQEILTHIKGMRTAKGDRLGKDFLKSDIKKIRQTERKELMGSAIIAQGTGENISAHEVQDNHKTSVYDVMSKRNEKELINSILSQTMALNVRQKSYIRKLIGINCPKAKNESQARINSGVTTTEAFKAKTFIHEELVKRGYQ